MLRAGVHHLAGRALHVELLDLLERVRLGRRCARPGARPRRGRRTARRAASSSTSVSRVPCAPMRRRSPTARRARSGRCACPGARRRRCIDEVDELLERDASPRRGRAPRSRGTAARRRRPPRRRTGTRGRRRARTGRPPCRRRGRRATARAARRGRAGPGALAVGAARAGAARRAAARSRRPRPGARPGGGAARTWRRRCRRPTNRRGMRASRGGRRDAGGDELAGLVAAHAGDEGEVVVGAAAVLAHVGPAADRRSGRRDRDRSSTGRASAAPSTTPSKRAFSAR